MVKTIYILEITIQGSRSEGSRILEIKGSDSLEVLARKILDSFNRDLDHEFGFFSNIIAMYDSLEQYTSFIGMDDKNEKFNTFSHQWIKRNRTNVKSVNICHAFEPSKKMLLFVDYDCLRFVVKCKACVCPKEDTNYPRITNKEEAVPEDLGTNEDSDS